MSAVSDHDLQSAFESAVKIQLAMYDVSVNCWQTAYRQGFGFTELLLQTWNSMLAGEARPAQSVRRYAEFGIQNSTELGRLSMDVSKVMLRTLAGIGVPARRPRPRHR